jgi:Zn-dependent M28 family amino/carboxypeptidase
MFFRSDHYPFARKGVPALFAVGNPDLQSGVSDEMAALFNDYSGRYHQRSDEYDESWDMRGIHGDARVFYRLGDALANTSVVPNWVIGSEYRGVRDRSRSVAARELARHAPHPSVAGSR